MGRGCKMAFLKIGYIRATNSPRTPERIFTPTPTRSIGFKNQTTEDTKD